MASGLATFAKHLTRTSIRPAIVEVGDLHAVKTCDELKVPIDREGPAYKYCYQHSVLSARILGGAILGYYTRNQVSQETGRPGENMGQLPAAAPIEPDEMPPALKYFNE